MAKEYAVKTAVLSCQYGSKPSELKIPYHRHIVVNDNGLGNISDITADCVGCFGVCSSPYNTVVSTDKKGEFFHEQELRGNVAEEACKVEIEIPWQNPQSDVYAAYSHALLEDCWTVCKRGYGIISVIESGQSPSNSIQKIIAMLNELDAEVESFMENNGIEPNDKNKLIESILLWNTYGDSGNLWNRVSDPDVRALATYLKDENPALYNFFERDIIIQDRNGQPVDLNYFIGMTKIGVRDGLDISKYYDSSIADDPARQNAYNDAADLANNYNKEVKDAKWSKIVEDLYGDRPKGSGSR